MTGARPFLEPGGQIAWVDMVKGAGILLVVFGHAWRGINEPGLIPDPELFRAVDRVIYTFHMPLFFFMSGLFLMGSIERRPLGTFLGARVTRLLWPLALWTWIFFLFRAAGGMAVNNPVDWAEFPFFPLPPQDHMWFLWALFLIHCGLALARPAFRFADGAVFWLVLLGGSALLAVMAPSDPTLAPWLRAAAQHLVFVILGMAAAQFGRVPGSGMVLALGGLAVFAVCAAISARGWVGYPERLALEIAMMLAFVAIFHGIAPHLGRVGRWLVVLGQASLAIYLSHTIFSAGLRIVMLAVGIDDMILHLVLGTAIGIAGPMVLIWLSARARTDRILGFSAG
jgi:fucose 4-O-acetylase-like acetyltransferase